MTSVNDLAVIDHLLQASAMPPEPVSEFREWKGTWAVLAPRWERPVDRALAGGLAADRPAWAFAAGYQAAIQCLTEPADITTIAAICITEKEGPHPARIESRLRPLPDRLGYWQLDGAKTFISGAEEADILWVAASVGRTPQGRNQLRMARVPARSNGVTLSPMPPLGLVPEMPHAQVQFKSVILPDNALLPGDGYLRAAKPFRTLEDLHVTAAFLAWMFGVGRRAGWPGDILEKLLALIISARGLALAPPLEPHVHIALGGLLGQMRHLMAEVESSWKDVDATTQERWQRDRKVLGIAETARRRRLEVAWRHYDKGILMGL